MLFSIYAILFYAIIREESDIDEIMEKGPQFNSVFLEGLGKRELENCRKEYSRQGINDQRIVKRLAELEEAERQQGFDTKFEPNQPGMPFKHASKEQGLWKLMFGK